MFVSCGCLVQFTGRRAETAFGIGRFCGSARGLSGAPLGVSGGLAGEGHRVLQAAGRVSLAAVGSRSLFPCGPLGPAVSPLLTWCARGSTLTCPVL